MVVTFFQITEKQKNKVESIEKANEEMAKALQETRKSLKRSNMAVKELFAQ